MIKAYVVLNSESAKENAELQSVKIDESTSGRVMIVSNEQIATECGGKLRYLFESHEAAIEAGADEDGITALKSGRVSVDPLYL